MKFSGIFLGLIATVAAAVGQVDAAAESIDPSSVNTANKELLVGVIIFDGVVALDMAGPTVYLELLPTLGVPVRFVTISNKQGRIQNDTKVALHAMTHYSDAPDQVDLLVIPGGPGRVQVLQDQGFLNYIKKAAHSATYVLSICTGASILSATGLLDGKRATTNKVAFNAIATAFPAINWVRQARWVVDGKYWTSSGVAAGLDMGHAFIAAQHGKPAADKMARFIEIVPNTDPMNDPFAEPN